MEQFSNVSNHGRYFSTNCNYFISLNIIVKITLSWNMQYFYYLQIAPFDATIDIDIKNVNFSLEPVEVLEMSLTLDTDDIIIWTVDSRTGIWFSPSNS